MKVLLIEDEPKLSSFMKEGLEENGHEVDVAFDGQIGKRFALKNAYDVVLLDIVIPLINGIELCKEIRTNKPGMPVIMITALGTTEDKIAGFDAGADDYLVKPFEFKELIARIRAVSNRSKGIVSNINKIQVGGLILNLDNMSVIRNGKKIELTAREFRLLEYLVRNKDHVVSRSDIAEKVWDMNFDTGTNIVDVYITYLRKKIDKDFEHKLIQTKTGIGYMLTDE